MLRMALDFEVEGQRKKGRLRRTWKRVMKVGLSREDAVCLSKWIVGISLYAIGLR